MTRFKLIIEYDGTGLCGWQRQEDRMSVQQLLEEAAQKLLSHPAEIVGAGRTDAGVHALGQVAHFDTSKDIDAYNVMHGMNYHLGPLTSQVIVIGAEPVQDDFHARFSAIMRSYCYRIVNRQARLAIDLNRAWHIPEKLDAQAMHKAAQCLLGHHDFTSFRGSECQAKSPLKTLDRLDVVRAGEDIRIFAQARSFLYNQVRNMVGTLRLVGNGKWDADRLANALRAKDRKMAGEAAPAHGLTLMQVGYELL